MSASCFIIRLSLFSILLIVSIDSRGEGGSSFYDFLNIPTSSYAFGLGGVNVSSQQNDIDLSDQNPSLIGPENEKQIKLGYMFYYGNSNFGSVRFGMPTGEHGAWAAGIRYLNYGNFRGFDESGSPSGDFTAQDIIVEGTYSHDFTYNLRGGINLKMVYSAYENYNAFALAADLGLSYYDDTHDLSLGLVLKNMGGQLKRFEDSYDRVPFDLQIGVTKGLGEFFSISATAHQLTRWRIPYYSYENGEESRDKSPGFFRDFFRHLIFGLEYSPSSRFYLLLAYNYNIYCEQTGFQRNFLSGFSIGTGFNVKSFSIGLGYSLPHKGASTLSVNLGMDLNTLIN